MAIWRFLSLELELQGMFGAIPGQDVVDQEIPLCHSKRPDML